MNNFCVESVLQNPKCKVLEQFDFASEEQIFDILLDVLKSELPPKLAELKDCQDKPMYISEDAIDLVPPESEQHFELMLNPMGDEPTYWDNREYRQVTYTIELLLTVHTVSPRCVTWELIRFKNAVEGLIVATEFVIDGYESVNVEPKGFSYFVPEVAEKIVRRQGSYKFTVTVSQSKI